MSKAKLLIVEDELVIALGLKKTLEKLGYEVVGIANTGEDAVRAVREKAPDLVLMDIILAGPMDGIEAALRIQADNDVPFIYLTANADPATVERARDSMPGGFLNKPINERDLLTNIDMAINRHRIERRLRMSEEKYRDLIDSLQDVIVSVDDKGIITFISSRITEIAGYTESEMMGKGFLSFIHPDDREKVVGLFASSKGGSHESGEYRGITKSGGTKWLRTSGRPTFIEGRFAGVKVVVSDVTGRREAEEEARRTNEELAASNEELQATIEELESINEQFEQQNRELLQAREELSRRDAMLRNILLVAPVGLGFIKDRLLEWSNSAFGDMFGYAGDEIRGKSLGMFYFAADDYKNALREMTGQILEKGRASFDVKAKRRDGIAIDVHLDSVPFERGNFDSGVVFAALDITEQKRAEAALRESEEKYRIIMENMTDSVWVLDLATMSFVYNSPSSVDILGYTDEESRRNRISDIVTPRSLEKVGRILAEELERDGKAGVDPNRSKILQLEQIHKNGFIVWTEMTLRFLRDETGRPVRILGVSRNITDRKRAEQALAESEEKYRVLAESISDLILTLDIETRHFTYMNRTSEELFGFRPEEIVALTMEDVLTPESLKLTTGILAEEIARDGAEGVDPHRSRTFELETRHKNGSVSWIEITARFLRDGTGAPTQVLGLARDITKRKQIEMALAEREERYRLLMDNTPENLWVIDISTMRFVYNSSFGSQILGYTDQESRSLSLRDILTDQSFEEVMRIYKEEMERDGRPDADRNRTLTFELEEIHKNGTLLWIETTAKFLRDESGRPYSILGVSRDITPRKYAEELLRLQRDLARALSAATSLEEAMGLCLDSAIKGSKMDSGGVYLMERETGGLRLVIHRGLNEEFIRKYAYFGPDTDNTRLVMSGRPLYYNHADIKAMMNGTEYREKLRTVGIIPIVHKGDIVAVMNLSSHSREDIPKAARTIIESIAAQMGDVIKRLEIQDSLKKSEEKFRKMIENSPIPIALMDNDTGRFSYFNKMLVKTLGYTVGDVPDMEAWYTAAYPDATYREEIRKKWEKAVVQAMARMSSFRTDEVDVRCGDGSYRRIEFRVMPMGPFSVIMINDLTDKKIHQEMLIQTEKMTSLGGLAAGMAHEINNPLGIVLQGVQATLNRLSPAVARNREEAERSGTTLDAVLDYLTNRDVMEYLDGIRDAAQRAAKIVSNMLQFSRRSESVIAPMDINQLIDRTIEIASSDYDLKKNYDFKRVRIVRDYDPSLGPVPCSETGIEQVILNLLKNSSQAMMSMKGEDFHPAITIRTLKQEPWVVITISDNGPGMNAEIRRHIFEPFYTTKGIGMGTGLGLSVSYYIITKTHDGTIDVTSKPGEGAVFTIKLPLVRQP
ncbi:MAG: PAS domain S-box protein [Spirochaetes bacterium]|nr:PAS domain S-box protein [Spirochaetota bacterium]